VNVHRSIPSLFKLQVVPAASSEFDVFDALHRHHHVSGIVCLIQFASCQLDRLPISASPTKIPQEHPRPHMAKEQWTTTADCANLLVMCVACFHAVVGLG
jgi:hypothetical protein